MNPLNNVIIDGTEDDVFQGEATDPPFALFSPDLQENIGGPYARREHAEETLVLIRQGVISPFFATRASAQRWVDLGGTLSTNRPES